VANRPGSNGGGAGRALALSAGIGIAVLVTGYLIFEFGRIQAGYDIVDVAVERNAQEERMQALEDEMLALKEQIRLLETHRDIDREAYREVETSLTALQQKIQEQRDAIGFYRGILSPDDGGRGLRVQELKLTRGANDREYYLNLVLVQVMQHERSVKGDVAFSLEGAQDGEIVTYTLEQLVPEDTDSDWPFSFRYFQSFDRQLILPDGFSPEKVHIEVRSKTKSIASVSQSFLWQTGQG
jgi:hypothetical protein